MKKKEIKIRESKSDFVYGSCATIAIASAFGYPYKAVSTICHALGIIDKMGLDFFKCKRVINFISQNGGFKAEYFPNDAKIAYFQLILLRKEKLIVVFDHHLSFAENGVIYDSFLQKGDDDLAKEYLTLKPTGWWIIKKYYE